MPRRKKTYTLTTVVRNVRSFEISHGERHRVLFFGHSSPYFIQKGNKERENNKSQNWIGLRVTKILFCEWEHGPLCLRIFGRLSDGVKTGESMVKKGAWQRKEQDARRAEGR